MAACNITDEPGRYVERSREENQWITPREREREPSCLAMGGASVAQIQLNLLSINKYRSWQIVTHQLRTSRERESWLYCPRTVELQFVYVNVFHLAGVCYYILLCISDFSASLNTEVNRKWFLLKLINISAVSRSGISSWFYSSRMLFYD